MRVGVRLVGIVAIAVAVAGCWPVPGAGPDRRAHNPFEARITVASVASLDEVWSRQLVTGSGEAVGNPVLTSRGVLVSAGYNSGAVHNLRWDGSTRWSRQVFDSFFRDVLAFDDVVAVADHEELEFWQTRFLDPGDGEPVAAPGVASSGRLEGIRDGVAVYESTSGVYNGYSSFAVVDIEAGTVWQGDHDQSRAPMTLGRDLLFDEGQGLVSLAGEPLRIRNGVRAYAYEDPQCSIPRGEPGWEMTCPEWATELDGGESSSVVVGEDQGTVFVVTDAQTAYALDAATGAIRWSTPVGVPNPEAPDAVPAAPALADGTLFVPTEDGHLVALDAATGERLWSAEAGSAVVEQPAVAGGVVVTGSYDGQVRAFDAAGCGAATCAAVWSDDVGSQVTGAPAIGFGLLVVGTADGRLVAYAPGGAAPA